MDSLTQFALGAGVGLAVLSRRIGPRRAALTGGVLGTLPDLDVLFPFDDPVDSFILHRGATHSFFVHALATPIFGEILVRLFKDLREERLRCYLAVYLIFVTHAVIDALRERFGVKGHEIRLETHGSDLPAVDDGRDYQPQNRRVEIRVRPAIDADEPQRAGAPEDAEEVPIWKRRASI